MYVAKDVSRCVIHGGRLHMVTWHIVAAPNPLHHEASQLMGGALRQVGFIKFVCHPFYEMLGELISPQFTPFFALIENQSHWQDELAKEQVALSSYWRMHEWICHVCFFNHVYARTMTLAVFERRAERSSSATWRRFEAQRRCEAKRSGEAWVKAAHQIPPCDFILLDSFVSTWSINIVLSLVCAHLAKH